MARIANPLVRYLKNRLHFWPWFIAVLAVGQVFQHFVFQLIGGVSRDNPLSAPLIGLYGITALGIIRRRAIFVVLYVGLN